MKICRICGVEKILENFNKVPSKVGFNSTCKECISKKNRERYQNDKEFREKIKLYSISYRKNREKVKYAEALWKKRNSKKIKAQKAINYALRSGKIERKPCQECGCLKSEAHHEDYDKPLEVKWLCFKHHRIEHCQYKYENCSKS